MQPWQRLQPILDLLDEGLVIYRRGFVRFVLVAALGMLPLLLGLGVAFGATEYYNNALSSVVLLLSIPLSLCVLVVTSGAISRSAVALRAGAPISLREAFRFGPRRILGMGCFSLIFLILINIISSLLSCLCILPAVFMLAGSASATGIFAPGGGPDPALIVVLGFLLSVIIVLLYGATLVISGATYCSFVYGLQAFALEQSGVRAAMGASFNLLFYRFGYNLSAFLVTGLAFAAMAGVVTIAIGVLVPLPLLLTLGEESPLAQAMSATAWLLGLAVSLPLLPIWMALLYRQNADMRNGSELEQRIALLKGM
jgi:hypothetical protein